MQELNVLKLVIESIVGLAVLAAVVLLLRSQRRQQQNGLADRSEERARLFDLANNAITHSSTAMEKVAAATDKAADAHEHLTTAIRTMAAKCPCGGGGEDDDAE